MCVLNTLVKWNRDFLPTNNERLVNQKSIWTIKVIVVPMLIFLTFNAVIAKYITNEWMAILQIF